MQSFSVVIICKNEQAIISKTLESLEGLTDDIVIYDNGSTDNTIEKIKKFNVRLCKGSWEGFGKTKNKAIALANHDWILNIDADEAIGDELKTTLLQMRFDDEKTVYSISFRNFIGDKLLRYGDWGKDQHIRLFNRKTTLWNEADVHEELILPAHASVKELKGYVLHRTWRDTEDYKYKMERYAMLGAEKYFRQRKKAGWIKRNLSHRFSFFRSYILKRGFLDGKAGWLCAKMIAYYTKLKYQKLNELIKKQK